MSRGPSARGGRGVVAALLVLLVLAGGVAGIARADEPPPPDGVAPAEAEADRAAASEPASPAGLEAWLEASPVALYSLLVLKYGMALLGLAFVVRAWRRWDRVRSGQAPAPPSRAPTLPFRAIEAVFLLVVFFVAGSLVAQAVLQGDPAARDSVVVKMALSQAILLPLGVLVIVRRYRLGAEPRGGRSWGRVLRGGFWTFCVASTAVLPTIYLTLVLLHALGRPIDLYGPVQDVIAGAGTARPWLIAFFAVVLAPIGEEAVFRGLLYPAVRSTGAPRWRVIAAAVLVSALFAGIHYHEASFLPLFTLALVLTWVFEWTNSLATVIVAHAMWNLATLLPLLLRSLA